VLLRLRKLYNGIVTSKCVVIVYLQTILLQQFVSQMQANLQLGLWQLLMTLFYTWTPDFVNMCSPTIYGRMYNCAVILVSLEVV